MNSEQFRLRPASIEEAGLFYSNDVQDKALGTVGHLRMDFGSGGKGFHHTWWPHNGDQFNTPEFKEILQAFVDVIRENGPLKNLSSTNAYCWKNGGAITEDERVYRYIAETEHYRFCLHCTPRPGDYQGYLYCYDLRRQNIGQQSHPEKRLGVTKDGIATVDLVFSLDGEQRFFEGYRKLERFRDDPMIAAAVETLHQELNVPDEGIKLGGL